MHHASLRLATMKPLAQHLFKRPWQWMLLLLIGLPFAWAAGVSINNMVITTVKQLSFAQSKAEVMVGAQYTQTATVRLSPGAVSYRSSNPLVAPVNAQTGQVSGVLPGEVSIFADQAAAAPYPPASASYTLRVKGQAVVFNPWQLLSVKADAPAFQIAAPSSNNPSGKISYSLKDGVSPVLSITETGLVTPKAVGKATIVATQAPSGAFESGSTEAVLEVTASTTTFTWPAQTTQLGRPLTLQNPTDSPNTVGLFSYTVKPDAQNRTIATVAGNVLTPISTGSTTLTVTQAAGGNYAGASLDVVLTIEPGSFTISGFTVSSPRTYDPVNAGANTFQLPLLNKPAGSQSDYTFTSEPAGIVSIAGRNVTVLKPGTVTLTATLPQDPAVHEAATASVTLEILKATPQITLSRVDKVTGDAPFVIAVSSSNAETPITLSLEGAPSIATLTGGANGQWTATILAAGTATLVAKQVASASGVFAETSASVPFVVTDAALLKPNTLALANAELLSSDTAPFKPAWTGAIGDPATIEVISGNTAVATVGADKQTLTITGLVGSTEITLKQPAQGGFRSAEVKATLTVKLGPYQITGLNNVTRTFDAVNPAANQFTLPQLDKPQGSTSTYSFSSSDTGVATINGRTVTVLKPGTTTITATLPQDPLRHRLATASMTLSVNKAIPVITVTDAKGIVPPAGAPFNDVPFSVTTNSDGQVTVALTNQQPSDVGLAFLNPATQQRYVRIYQAGTGTIDVITLESDTFAPGHATAYFLATNQAAMANTLGLADVEKLSSDAPFKPAWTNAIGDPATIEVSSDNPAVATVGADKQTITLTGQTGSAQIRLRQPPQGGYEFANVTATLTVKAGTVQITGLNNITRTFDAVNPAANQFDLPTLAKPPGSTVNFSFSSSDPAVATINGQRVTVLKPGTTTITASLPADPQHHQAASASATLTVNRATPIIALNLVEKVAGDPRFAIPVSSSNRDTPITLELQNPQPPGFATLVLDANQEWIATIQGIGTASLVAKQVASASGVFTEGSVSVPFNVRATALLPNTLALAAFDKLVSDAPFKPNWTGAVGDPATIVVSSGNAEVATVSTTDKQTITLTGRTGSAEITLTQEVQNGFQPAVVRAMLTVRPMAFQITGLSDITRTFDAVTPTANQFDLPTLTKPQGSTSSFSFTSSDTAVATIAGQRVTLLKPGTATITATLPEDPQRHAAASATANLTVNKALPAIGLADVNKALGDPDFKINVTSNSPQAIALALQNAQPPGFATLSQNANQEWIAHIVGVGSATIVATQGPSASGVFDSGSASAPFNVTPTALLPNPLGLAAFDKLTTDASFKPAWTNALGDIAAIEVSLTSNGAAVATVDPVNKQTITLTGQAGTAEVTLRQAASATHQAADVKALMTVRTGAAQAATLAFSPASFTRTYGDSPFTPSLLNTTDVLPTFTSSNAQVASVDSTGRVISILGAGTANITATVASPNFATTTAVATLTVNKRAANLAVNGSLLRSFANGPFDLPLSTLSSGALSVSSSNTGVATVALTPGSPPRVTPVGLGDTNLTITQAEDANHLAAQIQPAPKLTISGPQASMTWNVPSEIVFNAGAPTVSLPTATTSNTSSPISYSTTSSPAIGSLNGLNLTLNGTLGTLTLTASQPAGNGYAATQISTQVKVVSAASGTKANTALSAIGSIERNLADGAFTIPYQTDSDAPVVFTILTGSATLALDSSDPTGHRLMPKGAGEALVQLSQAATATRNAATPVRVNVLIKDGDPIFAFAPIDLSYNIDSPVVDIAPPQSRSVGEFSYTVVEGKDIVKLVGDRQLQMLAAGEATLVAVQQANGPYASDEATTRVTVRPQANNLAFNTGAMSLDTQGRVHRALSGPPSFAATASSRSPAPITYSSSRPSVASIDASSGTVTVRGLGETTLMASQAQAWTGFTAAQAQLVLKVDEAAGLSLAPFEVPLSQLTVVPPYTTTAPDRPVELSVDKPALASVAADRRSLNLLGEGTVQVTVTHPATTTQAAVSATASMTITARVPLISVMPASLQQVWTNAEQKIVLNPSSDSPVGGWQLTSNNPAVATVNGLEVTLKGVGTTSLLLTKPAGAGWAQGSLSIPVQVAAAVTELNDMSRPYGSPDVELPATLNGQSATYTSLTPGVADIVNGRSVRLNSVGSTQLQAKTAAGALIKEVRLTVTPGDPQLVMSNVSLASTAFGTTMKASSASGGKITYSILSGDTDWLADIRPSGELLVTGPGTVVVQASQEAQGNYASATTTASVGIAAGDPALLIVQGPPPVLRRGDSFEVRYRINFSMQGSGVSGGVFSDSQFGYVADANVERVSDTPPSKIGEEGRLVFRVKDTAELRGYRFAMASLYSYPFDRDLSGRFSDPNFYRDFSVQGVDKARYNLGQPLTMVVGAAPVMPKTYDANGAEITGNDRCTVFTSSNPGVLAGVGVPVGNAGYPVGQWTTVGSGTTVVGCNNSGYEGVSVTVVGADPLLQGFPAIDIGMDSDPYPLRPAASLNSTGAWQYEIVQLPGEPVVARIVNGEIYPLQAGRAHVRATQAANNRYREASIETELTVNPAATKSFATIVATYGDQDFAVPRPDGVATGTSIAYTIDPSAVATVVDGKVHIQGAGTATVTATWREGSADRTAQGQLTVLKAKPRLFFYVPPQVFGITACGVEWTWPIANQGSNNNVGGTLITNSDGALYYPMGVVPGTVSNGPNPDGRYWLRRMGTTVYVQPQAPDRPAWVEQAESANFLPARSDTLYYGLWANANVIWNESQQAWVTSCSQ